MLKIGIIGAGQTGRGLLPRLLNDHARFVFTDRDEALIDQLSAAGRYTIDFFGGARPPAQISNYCALPMAHAQAAQAFGACDAVFISVRAENTLEAGQWLKRACGADVPLVVCENAPSPAALVSPLGLNAASGAIFCTTTAGATLDIHSEDFPTLYVSAQNFPAALRGIDAITPVGDFDLLMKRKLYTYNAASAVIAYLGWQLGFERYGDAANDPKIAKALDGFYEEINRAICLEYGIAPEEQRKFAQLSRVKFQNRAILDTVARNAASPLRKLGADERILEPMRLILQNGGNADVLFKTAAAALRMAGANNAKEARAMLLGASAMEAGDPRVAQVLMEF